MLYIVLSHFPEAAMPRPTPEPVDLTKLRELALSVIAADKFLVKLGLLTGEPTKTMPDSGEKLIPAP